MGEAKTGEGIRYSVVVPFYNEQENIAPLYVKISEAMDGVGETYEMVFVDDGSGDESYRVLEDIYEHDQRVNLVRLRRNFGQTAALQAGFDHARGEVVIAMDGDGQQDPKDIPKLLGKLEEGYDIVNGWRYARTENWVTRRAPSRMANWLMAKLSGVPLRDFGSTFKAYRKETLERVQLYGEQHRFIPALASWSGARVAEVKVGHAARRRGKSNYGISRTVRVLLDLVTIKFLLDFSTRPLQFFGLPGLVALLGGGAILFGLFLKKVVWQESLMVQHGPLLLLGITLLIGGIQFVSMGLLGEMLARTYYETQKKKIYSVREVRSRGREAVDAAGAGGARGSSLP